MYGQLWLASVCAGSKIAFRGRRLPQKLEFIKLFGHGLREVKFSVLGKGSLGAS